METCFIIFFLSRTIYLLEELSLVPLVSIRFKNTRTIHSLARIFEKGERRKLEIGRIRGGMAARNFPGETFLFLRFRDETFRYFFGKEDADRITRMVHLIPRASVFAQARVKRENACLAKRREGRRREACGGIASLCKMEKLYYFLDSRIFARLSIHDTCYTYIYIYTHITQF